MPRHPARRPLTPIEPLESRLHLSTSTINAASTIRTIAPDLLGINVATWDPYLNTSTTLQLSQAAGLDAVRMPGGSTTDTWHFNTTLGSWAMSIGQMAEYATQLNATAVVTVNYGTGSPQEAVAEWAYLCGSPTDTTAIGTGMEFNTTTNTWQAVNWQTVGYWASLREASPLKTDDGLNFLRLGPGSSVDHPGAFVIPYWEMGNEVYGSWETDEHGIAGDGLTLPNGASSAAHDPTTYVTFIKAFATQVRSIIAEEGAPAINIGVVSGATDTSYGNWITNVLKQCKSQGIIPDFISDHLYDENPGGENDASLLADPHTAVTPTPSNPDDWSQRAAKYQSIITTTLGSLGNNIQLMATEINSVSSDPGKQSVSLVNGLFMADSLGSIMDTAYNGAWDWDLYNGGSTAYNDSSSLYGWREYGDYGILGNASVTGDNLYMPEPDYFAEQLFAKIDQSGATVVSATSDSTLFDTFAVLEPNGHLDLLIVNKTPPSASPPNNLPDPTITEQFNLQNFKAAGAATIWQYGVAQDDAQDTTGTSALSQQTTTFTTTGASFTLNVPDYSMTVVDLSPALTLSGSAMYLKRDNDGQYVDVWNNSTATGSYAEQFPLAQLGNLTITATTGSSGAFVFDTSNGDFLPANAVTFAGDGSNSLQLIVTTGNDSLSAGTAALVFDNNSIQYTGAASLQFNPNGGDDAFSLQGAVKLALTAPPSGGGVLVRQFSSLSLGTGSELDIANPGAAADRALLVVSNLSLPFNGTTPTAKLDLGANDMDIASGNLTTINQALAAGLNLAAANAGTGALWQGEGIASSAAAANRPMALGAIQNNGSGTALYGTGAPNGLFDGYSPGASDILIKYTLTGDANLDGSITTADYALTDDGFNRNLNGWYHGDFNYDGVINGDDYSLLDNSFNLQNSLSTQSTVKQATPAASALLATSTAAFFVPTRSAPAKSSNRTTALPPSPAPPPSNSTFPTFAAAATIPASNPTDSSPDDPWWTNTDAVLQAVDV